MIAMYTLKGIFPEPKREQKKNFIKENMKQLKFIQGKASIEPKFSVPGHGQRGRSPGGAGAALGQVKSSPSAKSGKLALNVGKTNSTNSRKKLPSMRIKKGDMAEFLRRKEMLHHQKPLDDSAEEDVRSSESSGRLRDIGCQTMESNLSQRFEESTKLTMIYPKTDEDADAKLKASGDSDRHRSPTGPAQTPHRAGDELQDYDRPRSKLNSILERKDQDPYLPSGYQKGVLPKYLRARLSAPRAPAGAPAGAAGGAAGGACPAGHVALPDQERKETLRMLRNSFAELVSELNKMPVKTDTLRMRSRKAELERQLAKLEDGIKVFSRPAVFVKIGE